MEKLSKSKRKEIFNLVKKLTKIFSLKGINNIDLIEKENILYLIEINSRPGLSSKIIYEINGGPFIKEEKNPNKKFHATKIIYSSKRIIIKKKNIKFFKNYCNSNKFSELPNERDIIKVNQPICLLHLMAKNKKLLEKMLHVETNNFLNELENNL